MTSTQTISGLGKHTEHICFCSIIIMNWTVANFHYRLSFQSICTPTPPPHSLHSSFIHPTHGVIYTFMTPKHEPVYGESSAAVSPLRILAILSVVTPPVECFFPSPPFIFHDTAGAREKVIRTTARPVSGTERREDFSRSRSRQAGRLSVNLQSNWRLWEGTRRALWRIRDCANSVKAKENSDKRNTI